MKKIVSISFLILLWQSFVFAQAQTPDAAKYKADIPAVEEKQQTSAEYKSSADYWQQQVALNASNEDAWMNLYKASRYTNYTEHSRSISTESQAKLNDVLARMNNAVPNSFAWNYCSYLNSNRSDESVAYLKKANTIRPDEQELWDDMLCEAIIAEDATNKYAFSKKLSDAKIYSDAEMEYNRNVLNSVEKDGVLVTHGNVDTYPIIVLQQLYAVRTDVQVICLDWYGSNRYIYKVNAQLGLKEGKNKKSDPYTSLANILSSAKDKSIYLALTLPPDVLKQQAKNLYCTGLAMKYSKNELQNLESLKFNWESLFQKNFIQMNEAINRNYLVPLLLLKEAYASQGNTTSADGMKQMAELIATRFAVKTQIQKQLD